MKDGRTIKLSKEAIAKLEKLRNTPLGKIPIGECASRIIILYEEREQS